MHDAISRQRAITREERSVYIPFMSAYRLISKCAPDARFDIAVRLICGHEDFVWIVLTESREVNQQAVFVWHSDLDVIYLSPSSRALSAIS